MLDLRLLPLLFKFLYIVEGDYFNEQRTEESSIYYTEPTIFVNASNDVLGSNNNVYEGLTEFRGGHIIRGQRTFERSKSPYLVREDIFIERDAELIVEPGVEIRFSPMIGITVRGIVIFKGQPDSKILLNAAELGEYYYGENSSSTMRLVDGSSPLEGRLEIFHRNEWRSVCTNSRNWTRADFETTCRHLGFQGGKWWTWVDRQWPAKPRLLYEEPQCRGIETSLQHCQGWSGRQLGAGVCDYHPDIGISCLPRHDGATKAIKHWRGIRFEDAPYDTHLTQENTLYVKRSKSVLEHVTIQHAGTGRDYNVTSALHVQGVPPRMEFISILDSAYTGLNVTHPDAPTIIKNCTVQRNKGYGIYIHSSTGPFHIDDCSISNNGADGIKYLHKDALPEDAINTTNTYDWCTAPTTSSQTFPITILMEQNQYAPNEKDCPRHVFTQPGQVLTVHFLRIMTDKNDKSRLEIYDGVSEDHQLLSRIIIKNGTLPQSVTSTRRHIFMKFVAESRTSTVILARLVSGYEKTYDLKVSNSSISSNNGRGILVEKLRSGLHVHESTISNNQHVAGVHVLGGTMDINITRSRISFNRGDGINITVTGGNRNLSRSIVSSNQGFGFTVWLNDSRTSDYLYFNQTTVVEYSEILKNQDIGVYIGNSSGNSYVNISGNLFSSSTNVGLKVESSWRYGMESLTRLQIGHNLFTLNEKVGIELSPAINLLGTIEYNRFKSQTNGALLIKNSLSEELNVLPVDIIVRSNEFINNEGTFVVSLGLSPYSDVQRLLFTRNFLRDNRVKEAFDKEGTRMKKFMSRSRIAAVVVISSNTTQIFRNIFDNPESKYEIGSHLEDQSMIINCTYNWLGSDEESIIYERLFHRKDRYNLAKIEYLPFLLHNSQPGTTTIVKTSLLVAYFIKPGTRLIGGEVDGTEKLNPGEYIVERDINVRPDGKLIIQPGVTLKFPAAVGMMVAGKLEARGTRSKIILFTLDQDTMMMDSSNDTTMEEDTLTVPIRLLGGKNNLEGRLQVRIGTKWGTVCNHGWNIRNAALVCHQLGYVLDPDDWNLERWEVPRAGTNEDVILSNVRCTEDDTDIRKCLAEKEIDFENSCNHENDVGVRCSEIAWAGLRLGPLAHQSNLQYLTIEKAGLLDYTTNSLKPALQIDFSRHSLEGVRVIDNLQDGLGVLYSDMYSMDSSNIIKDSDFSNNGGSGISFKQLGMRIVNSRIEKNKIAGIRHNPALSAVQQREFAGWFVRSMGTSIDYPYHPIVVPYHEGNIHIDHGDTKYIVTGKLEGKNIHKFYNVTCKLGYVVGIQLLNPIENRSTEQIIVHDSQFLKVNHNVWQVKRDLSVFPVASSSYVVILEYHSGEHAIGGTVLVVSSLRAPVQNTKNKIIGGPIPTLLVSNTEIKNNRKGILGSYYNRYLNELGDHYLRKSNETMKFLDCDISRNFEEAILINSADWNVIGSTNNVSEITIHVNRTLITDNTRGITQYGQDARYSMNLFHWILQDNTIERNRGGGFVISLPDNWRYNVNLTHSLYFGNNTWRNNEEFAFVVDGHFAKLNISNDKFIDNQCKTGLISLRGMEKQMKINENRIEGNVGSFMIEFNIESQSEIVGDVDAKFEYNIVKGNRRGNDRRTSYVVGFRGIQKVRINRNLFGNNEMDYELLAGIRTARINNEVDVTENWWGVSDDNNISRLIFDFDDWNDHAVANYRPYLISDSLTSSISASWRISEGQTDVDHLGGRIVKSRFVRPKDTPYLIRSDITVMPGATLYIEPDVVMEFAPNVGILVLGTLEAVGLPGHEIIMRPIKQKVEDNFIKIVKNNTIRFCKNGLCSSDYDEGFVEVFNSTTFQWVPLCDIGFTERNAQVTCRELGLETINVYVSYDRRYEFNPGSLNRIWSWMESLQCTGSEENLNECEVRLNGEFVGRRHECPWNGRFVFVHCGQRNLPNEYDYWGGIRIANGEFEQHLYEHRIHDVVTHKTIRRVESELRYINITGAGILHKEKSAAVQSIVKSPMIYHVRVTSSAHHGINVIAPTHTMELLFNTVENVFGNGLNVLSLTGEGREAEESSFTPTKDLNFPYSLFSLIDVCDTSKEIIVEERVLIYYKYDNYPVNCAKIFRSADKTRPFGFRLLQFNLLNSTSGLGGRARADAIDLYDGDMYNVTAKKIARLESNSPDEKKLFRTRSPSLGVRLFANGASNVHGFIAEIVTLRISAIGYNRDAQHNISYSVMKNCREGAIRYTNVGEVNAMITVERNRFIQNCDKLYGNFSTCKSALWFDIQNTQSLFFRNNLIESNQGGLYVRVDSRGSATSLKGWIHNNLFTKNFNEPCLYIEGRQSSPYQEVTVYRNYLTKNYAPYTNVVVLKQVVSNMTLNYLHDNVGSHILEISGFDGVRLPIYQSTSHNGFYKNEALDRCGGRSTIIAGTPGQQYVDNVFFNPDNDYEMMTTNQSRHFESWRSQVDARYNWWSYNETLAVSSRIRDRNDSPELLLVDYQPFHMNNKSVLAGKCPPAWDLVGDTCYIYIGAPMDFFSAREFCQSADATMPFVMGDYTELWLFLSKQQERFDYGSRVWVQQLDRVDQCTIFAYHTIETDHCDRANPFVCEIDPQVHIDPLSWRKDILAVGVLSAMGIALALMTTSIALWVSKSKKRNLERLERRNSIRQSLHSLRSVGSTSGFTELSHRRKPITKSSTTDTLKSLDYRRMLSGGSLDSMDKSQLNTSIEDNPSCCYDVYENHNSRYSTSTTSNNDFTATIVPQTKFVSSRNLEPIDNNYDLAYRNEGFRNHSTFTSRNNSEWGGVSVMTEDTIEPVGSSYLNNVSTLPINSSLALSDSISELKRDIDVTGDNNYNSMTSQRSESVPEYRAGFEPPLPPHPYDFQLNEDDRLRPKSEVIIETNLDTGEEKPLRSKSETLLETNLDGYGNNEPTELTQLSLGLRSKSQPLETAM